MTQPASKGWKGLLDTYVDNDIEIIKLYSGITARITPGSRVRAEPLRLPV